MPKEIIAVLGATASGKSALALSLAARHGGEIVSCDSMQIYKGMDIGTAKPTKEEMRAVPHHMIDIASPDDDFSAGDYAAAASDAIDGIIARGRLPVVCGGTFLYLDALTEVSSYSEAVKDEALRASLAEYAKDHGASALHRELEKVDPVSAEAIHENNVKRVIRAIEIYRTTGKPKSVWDAESKEAEPPYRARRIIIEYRERSILYDRIDRRVDAMMASGLEAEVKALYERGALSPEKIASQAIGYKEFIDYFEGYATLGETVDRIKQSSRNYAKRQLTWLKRYKDALVVFGDESGSARASEDIAAEAEELLFDAKGECKNA